jgi:hypothetical protein
MASSRAKFTFTFTHFPCSFYLPVFQSTYLHAYTSSVWRTQIDTELPFLWYSILPCTQQFTVCPSELEVQNTGRWLTALVQACRCVYPGIATSSECGASGPYCLPKAIKQDQPYEQVQKPGKISWGLIHTLAFDNCQRFQAAQLVCCM